jgi:hypothetical protein
VKLKTKTLEEQHIRLLIRHVLMNLNIIYIRLFTIKYQKQKKSLHYKIDVRNIKKIGVKVKYC